MIFIESEVLETESFLKEVNRKLHCNDDNICLYDNSTKEKITISDELKDLIKNYYQEKLINKI